MTDPTTARRERRSRPPLWLVEGLDIVVRKRAVLIAVALGVALLGAGLAWLFPTVVPPVPLVGAAVGAAALLLGLATVVAVDATDLTIRGPRHVGAAGGELVAVLPTEPSEEAAGPLAAAVLEAREPARPLLLGMAAAGPDARTTVAWTQKLGRALVHQNVSVLTIDLASGRTEPPGLAEVVFEGVKLTAAVDFEPGVKLARLGAGGDHADALDALTQLPGRLPRDLDVVLVALPTAASRKVVGAVRCLDHVLVVSERDRTARVDLIAGLDALARAGTRAQVALLDDPTASMLGAGTAGQMVARDGGEADGATDRDEGEDDELEPAVRIVPRPSQPRDEDDRQPDTEVADGDQARESDEVADDDGVPPTGGAFPPAVAGTAVAAGLGAVIGSSQVEGGDDRDAEQPPSDAGSEPATGAAPGDTAPDPVDPVDPIDPDDPLGPVDDGTLPSGEAAVATPPSAEDDVTQALPRVQVPGDEASATGDGDPDGPDEAAAASEQRDAEVVRGAAEAAAIALAEAEPVDGLDELGPTRDHEVDPHHLGHPRDVAPIELEPAPSTGPATRSADTAEVAEGSNDGDVSADDVSADDASGDDVAVPDASVGDTPAGDAVGGEGEDTDELPAARARTRDERHDDMLRTTAQLATLEDELDAREPDHGGDDRP